MGSLGRVRIGHKAPDFHCDAVIKGVIEDVSLSTFINEKKQQWLILLFIPAAFSFVCPTEVLAFQNCLDEFRDRNCDVVFISVDTKHSLWHWQNVPRQYGGLGQIAIALLSDANHKMSRDYGVLIDEEGVCLRGMFILDDSAVVQQITLNNLTVGRSVLEALRLLEAFQAVAKHGVLCPIDWKPSGNTNEMINTISNTLTESYDERLANLQKDFGDTPLIDLDAKHAREGSGSRQSEGPKRNSSSSINSSNSALGNGSQQLRTENSRSSLNIAKDKLISFKEALSSSPTTPSASSVVHRTPSSPAIAPKGPGDRPEVNHAHSAPATSTSTPATTPGSTRPRPVQRPKSIPITARHSRGHSSALGRHTPSKAPQLFLSKHNSWESRRGSHVVLEFADPISLPQTLHPVPASSPHVSPLPTPTVSSQNSSPCLSKQASMNHYPTHPRPSYSRTLTSSTSGRGRADTPPPKTTHSPSEGPPYQTRLQATFEAIKKMSSGLGSPRVDFRPRKTGKEEEGLKSGERSRASEGWGYFDVVPEVVEA